MNVLILSGGSGNATLIRGLKSLYPSIDVKVLVNAYDAGKSTGVCRRVTDTLGVSDIRKNHIRMYEATTKYPNKCILEFYKDRYDFTKGQERDEIIAKLTEWNLAQFIDFVQAFFSRPQSKEYKYNDFNVSNIVYAEMYAALGYAKTNAIFCDLLGIDDFLLLNSFDNVYIQARTQSGHLIEDEGDIVEYCNPMDIITGIEYIGECNNRLNKKAIEAIQAADYIVISTGTFWSSIYPTLQYGDLYKYINASNAKKVWAMNNECDKDSWGVGSNQLINFFEELGLNLHDFQILENLDAVQILKETNPTYRIVYRHMESVGGKHNSQKYAAEILRLYYGLETADRYDSILFDFDDTLWARNASTDDPQLLWYSIDNLRLMNQYLRAKSAIISGNSYESIHDKLVTVYGSHFDSFHVDVWADANTNCYRKGVLVDSIPDFVINLDCVQRITQYLSETHNIVPEIVKGTDSTSCLKIKPLDGFTRKLLALYLNNFAFEQIGCSQCKAVTTGSTTLDILHANNTKAKLLDVLNCVGKQVLYIGDEINSGNDAEIAVKCSTHINTSGVEETHCILELLSRG